jgi:hypothetical protein
MKMLAGLGAATLLVLATTLDDAVWLVPFVGSRSLPWSIRTLHATVFVATLTGLSSACVILATVLAQTTTSRSSSAKNRELYLGGFAALLCWGIALFLYIRIRIKRANRQRNQVTLSSANHGDSTLLLSGNDPKDNNDNDCITSGDYGSAGVAPDVEVVVLQRPPPLDEDLPVRNNTNGHSSSPTASPWTVASLTAAGALDEISYFPALILGRVFSPMQLCLGTFLAAVVMLGIVTSATNLAASQPLMEALDRVPLYGIVAGFAMILTIETIVDAVG